MALTSPVEKSNLLYLTIAQGEMVQKSTKDNPRAEQRTYTVKENGEEVEKKRWEIKHRNLTGFIKSLNLRKGKFGEDLEVQITDGEDTAQLSFSADSDYFSDFVKRLKNVDLTKQVILRPYDIPNKDPNKRSTRGISIEQDGEKIKSYFWDPVKKKPINGIPVVSEEERGNYDKDDWKIHFMQVRKFLKKQLADITEEIPTRPVVQKDTTRVADEPVAEGYDDEDDVPF